MEGAASAARSRRQVAGWVVAPALLSVLAIQLVVLWHPLAGKGLAGPSVGYVLTSLRELAMFMGGAAAIRIVIHLILRARRPDTHPSPGRRKVAAWVWDLAWLLVGLAVLTTTYVWLKVYVPAFGGALWDGRLAALDRRLSLGVDPNVVLLTIFSEGPRWAARALDLQYGAFVVTMEAASAWFITDFSPRRRRAFALGFAALWSSGLWGYLALPCLGPAFSTTALTADIARTFPLAARTQALLLTNYSTVVAALGQPAANPIIVPEFGVAAMPSMHVAALAFLAMWSWRAQPALRLVLSVAAGLTFVGSVATGWHYAVDSWAGLLLAAAVYAAVRLACRGAAADGDLEPVADRTLSGG